jgi:hypothetical protein
VAAKQSSLIPVERIERAIVVLRGEKAMLDSDLAALYGVTTKQLNQAVKRNKERFPADFMFQLTMDEAHEIRSMNNDPAGRNSRSAIVQRGKNIK